MRAAAGALFEGKPIRRVSFPASLFPVKAKPQKRGTVFSRDKKAREITEDAQKEKLDSEKEIAENARKMRENYLEKARNRIQLNAETERAAAEQNWQRTDAHYAEQLRRLEEVFASRRGELTDAIVRNVLAGEG